MKVNKAPLDGVFIIEPKVFEDPRGIFYEVYVAKRYEEHGISVNFIQDNNHH